jgi:hypothetical protein
MEHILKPPTWEPIARYYWIRLALALLLTVVVEEDITLSVPSYMEGGDDEGDGDVAMGDAMADGDEGMLDAEVMGFRQGLYEKHLVWKQGPSSGANMSLFMTSLRNLGVFDKLSAQVFFSFLPLSSFFPFLLSSSPFFPPFFSSPPFSSPSPFILSPFSVLSHFP